MTRHVGFLVYPGFVLLDLSGPLEAFANANPMASPAYQLTVASLEGGMVRSACDLRVATVPLPSLTLDTFIIVGSPEPPMGAWVAPLTVAIREMAARSRRTACVCTGAFLLAASGLLDGRAATTHWSFAPRLQERYPALRVDGNRMWTEEGGIWTSAGMSAGIDMMSCHDRAGPGQGCSAGGCAHAGGLLPPVERTVPILLTAESGSGPGSHPQDAALRPGAFA